MKEQKMNNYVSFGWGNGFEMALWTKKGSPIDLKEAEEKRMNDSHKGFPWGNDVQIFVSENGPVGPDVFDMIKYKKIESHVSDNMVEGLIEKFLSD